MTTALVRNRPAASESVDDFAGDGGCGRWTRSDAAVGVELAPRAVWCATGAIALCVGYHAGLKLAGVLFAGHAKLFIWTAMPATGIGLARLALGVAVATTSRRSDAHSAGGTALSHEGWSRLDLLGLAFVTALVLYRGKRSGHFLVALVVGAALTHLGWAALYWNLVRAHPGVLLDPLVGSCVLFLPLGPLLVAPEAASWRALPAALAVARTACIFGGCCYGKPLFLGAPIGILAEVSALLTLHATLWRVPDGWVLPLFLATFGSLRLLLEPLRSAPPLGPPLVPAVALAGLWAGLGVCGAVAQSVRVLRS